MLPKLEYSALRTAAKQVGYTELPELAPENASDDEQFLSKLHHCLLNVISNVLDYLLNDVDQCHGRRAGMS